MTRSTDELICSLADRASPALPLPAPALRTAAWLCAVLPLVALATSVAGMRADASVRIGDASFVGHALVLLGGAAASAFAALTLAVPGHPSTTFIARGAVVLALCTVLLAVTPPVFEPSAIGVGTRCVRTIVGFTAVGAVPFAWMFRHGIVVVTCRQVFFGVGACAFVADAASRFICRLDGCLHLLLWHALPVVLVAAGGAAVAPAIACVLRRYKLRRPKELL